MISARPATLPGQQETWRWWVRVAVLAVGLIAASAAGGVALGRRPSDAVVLAVVFTAIPVSATVFSVRRQRRAREREVVIGLDPDRQRAALAAYAGEERTDDPTVAHDAVRLMLTVAGDAMAVSGVAAVVAVLLGVGFVVVAVVASPWWWVDAAASFGYAALVYARSRQLSHRLRSLKTTAALKHDIS